MPWSGRVAIIAPPHSTRTTIARRPLACGQSNQQAGQIRGNGGQRAAYIVEYARFPGRTGFPLATKKRYNSLVANGRKRRLGLFPSALLFMPRSAIGRAKFRAYMLLIHS
jgi:hypothetical protein